MGTSVLPLDLGMLAETLRKITHRSAFSISWTAEQHFLGDTCSRYEPVPILEMDGAVFILSSSSTAE
jgi:hypothetical protein